MRFQVNNRVSKLILFPSYVSKFIVTYSSGLSRKVFPGKNDRKTICTIFLFHYKQITYYSVNFVISVRIRMFWGVAWGDSPKNPVQERLKLEFDMDFASKITFLHMTSHHLCIL